MKKLLKSLLVSVLLMILCGTLASAAETRVHRKSQPLVAELFVTSW